MACARAFSRAALLCFCFGLSLRARQVLKKVRERNQRPAPMTQERVEVAKPVAEVRLPLREVSHRVVAGVPGAQTSPILVAPLNQEAELEEKVLQEAALR